MNPWTVIGWGVVGYFAGQLFFLLGLAGYMIVSRTCFHIRAQKHIRGRASVSAVVRHLLKDSKP